MQSGDKNEEKTKINLLKTNYIDVIEYELNGDEKYLEKYKMFSENFI
ncbi:hypothetical protein [Acholeplasma hippikon]|uniref:Uncharacterized protein n=1 Tax=Acholeplasma hippikon TaxID=264636 RepID=A0A449BJW9_9MOLU|nr:hypothetical protein [Acholeplasma hippikon]VEU82738.1 Uncharacterised protein [Acholeplasma hippikon]